MNRRVKLTIALILTGAAVNTSAQQRPSEPVAFKKISDRLYSIVGRRGAQGGAYIGDAGVLTVERKTPLAHQRSGRRCRIHAPASRACAHHDAQSQQRTGLQVNANWAQPTVAPRQWSLGGFSA